MATQTAMSNLERDPEILSTFENKLDVMSTFENELNKVVNDAPHSLLATARIRVRNGRDSLETMRFLCDTGAQVNLLSNVAFARLKLMRKANKTNVVGVGGASVVTMGKVTVQLWHHLHEELIDVVSFTIIEGMETIHPYQSFPSINFEHIENRELADPAFNERAPIDGMIGVNVLSRHLGYQLQRTQFEFLTQRTSFGWIVFGGRQPQEPNDVLTTVNVTTTHDLYSMVKRLWEIDEMPDTPIKSADEIKCEDLYGSTLVRNDGRYSVTLLLKPDAELGQSRAQALRRWYSVERRLKQNPDVREKYIQFMTEYERLGHMQKADPLESGARHYYIPHHAVAIDRKFRVVFDASAKSSNGNSLNDVVYAGPTLQRALDDILMTFRTGRIAMSADIAKMFRQIQVQPEHWNLQRILYRKSADDSITEYWLTVVTYGMKSSPYNAVRTLNQCATDHSEQYGEAAKIVLSDFYVDDLLTSMDTESEAIRTKEEVSSLLKLGGFELTKWCSNYAKAMDTEGDDKLLVERDSTSVLGIAWNYHTDMFHFKVESRAQPDVLTKRIVTSEAARIFDPQGYVAPITVRAKMFIQELWRVKKGWDEPLPQQFQTEWKAFCTEVKKIEQFRIPRWIGTSSTTVRQIHIFCDASARAYGAVAYIRTRTNDQWTANLLRAKSKVAPLKELTIPRLELCAMELGSKLLERIQQIQTFSEAPAFMWTDSEIVLHWLRKPCNELKVYVANRVLRILRIIKIEQCGHVPSESNPADLLSRGARVETLLNHALWWNGPELLQQDLSSWPQWQPNKDIHMSEIVGSEIRRPPTRVDTALLTTRMDGGTETNLIERWGSYHKVCRITAYALRFCHATYKGLVKRRDPTSHWLMEYNKGEWKSDTFVSVTIRNEQSRIQRPSLCEHRIALNYWTMLSQRTSFPDEIAAVSNKKLVDRKSNLYQLTPQIDEDQLLRICGRLGNTQLPYEVKHPIILSRTSTLAKLVAEEAHLFLCHGGVQLCTQYLRNKYWIVGVRILLRTVVQKCIVCTRYRQQTERQFMADIPARRLDTSPAFEYTGVDYAGPITLRLTRNTSIKGWIAVFICMRYKAVHLELVSGLDTDSFLAALQRFVNLRGGCVHHMHSDNGTNFIGAARELREAAESWQNHQVVEYLQMNAIEWHNITPFAPHHGGAWESMVKIMKNHLKKMAGAQLFSFEELATLLTKISACINSRPLTPLSTDPSDLTALTPSHFVSTRPIVSPLEPQLADVPMNRLSAWQRITRLQQDFSDRWRKECFSEQQRRNKWAGVYRSMKVGDLVLIRSDTAPACRWPMGRVVEVFHGTDGHIRSCRIKTERTEMERPVTKLCLLPIDGGEETSETGFCPE